MQSSLNEEIFTYDNLHRLTEARLNGTATVTLTYDAAGRIDNKSDTGSFSYFSGSHAVKEVTGTRAASYDYDNNGNMTCRLGTGSNCTGGDTITWTSFNKPVQINKGNNHDIFSYGPDQSRFKRVSKLGSDITTIRYVAGLYEKAESGGVTTHRHFIYADGQTIATHERYSNANPDTTNYLHRDYQGSVEVITNSAGTELERFSYDAFGKRRYDDWSADTSDNLYGYAHLSDRAYTGHESLDSTVLTHMNGRIQDPVLGRMLSADPTIPMPMNGQSYDRYAYVLNNPMKYTDPSGFQPVQALDGGSDPNDPFKPLPCQPCDNSQLQMPHFPLRWDLLNQLHYASLRNPPSDNTEGQNSPPAPGPREPGDGTSSGTQEALISNKSFADDFDITAIDPNDQYSQAEWDYILARLSPTSPGDSAVFMNQMNCPAYNACVFRLRKISDALQDRVIDINTPGDYDEIPEGFRDFARALAKSLLGDILVGEVISGTCRELNPCNAIKYPHLNSARPSGKVTENILRKIGE